MIIIGLTGGLASGKTRIAKMFADLGAQVLHADSIAHRALFKNTYCYKQVIGKFGKSILNADGSINRKKLARLAFSSDKKQQQLCRVIHPWVFAYIREKIEKIEKNKAVKAVIIEAVMLIESGLYKDMDKILVVRSTAAQQISRATLERRMTQAQVKQRMRFQLGFTQKSRYADYIIDNRGALKDTEKKAKKIWELILRKNNL
ncbi:MAG: dephospho-CoA kinase [Candidatus Omnitrophica bacterium]|nr:dephospho-CoA kinase [Candidatus Omnitrophota bacterium]